MNEETKKCPFCIKEISALATKCPYCQSTIKIPMRSFSLHGSRPKNDSKRLVLTAFAVIFGSFLLLGLFSASGSKSGSSSHSSVPSSNSSTSDLKVRVQTGGSGIHITNLESTDWSNCMVGVNGGNGWNFNKPPFRTRNPFDVKAGQVVIISWSKVTTDDGTAFSPITHTVNNSVVICNQGEVNARYWNGSTR